MKNNKGLDFKIDKLTNSIEKVGTGEVFETIITRLTKTDLKYLNGQKWKFNWKKVSLDKKYEVVKLVILNNQGEIHGLMNYSVENDHVFIHLLENSPMNYGKSKKFEGVAGNLVAYACKISFENGFNGVVVFISKSRLINHYKKSLNAEVLFGHKMYIETKNSLSLVNRYFKEFKP